MGHEHLASAFVELPQVAQAASCPNRVLHHPPKTFDVILVFYQFRQLFYTASPLSEDSWDFFGSFSGRRL